MSPELITHSRGARARSGRLVSIIRRQGSSRQGDPSRGSSSTGNGQSNNFRFGDHDTSNNGVVDVNQVNNGTGFQPNGSNGFQSNSGSGSQTSGSSESLVTSSTVELPTPSAPSNTTGSLTPNIPSSSGGPPTSGVGSGSTGSGSTSGGSQTNNTGGFGKGFCPFCIPDNNPRVIYTGPWTLSTSGVFGTTHSTTTPGSSLSFTFNGSGIVVFGTVPISNSSLPPPSAVYVIDAAPPFETSEPLADQAVPNQPLFAASQLSRQEHKLTIKVIGAQAPYTIDSFFVFPLPSSTRDTVSESPSVSPVPSSSLPSSETKATTNPQRIVNIVAGVLSTFIFVLLVVITLFIIRRRRRIRCPESLYTEKRPSRRLRDTIFTSTESIIRNNPSSMWSNYTRSDGPSSTYNANPFVPLPSPPPPLPPKPTRYLSPLLLSEQPQLPA